MANDNIRITLHDALAQDQDRFHRFSLIGWWDQNKLANAKALVVGAGALGNEIVKNLALLGFGHVLILDMDRVENSNLSRSVLYRAADNGSPKSEVAARSARDIYLGMTVHHLVGNVIHDVGMGVFRWAAQNQLQRSYKEAAQQVRLTFGRVEEVAVAHGASLPTR
jgi:tRNA A37 threonylcarbamoyladenosine dehydratase